MKALLGLLLVCTTFITGAAQPAYQRNVLTTNDPPLVAFVLTPQASTNGLPNALRLTNASGTLTTNAQGYLVITTTGGSATNAQPPSDNLTNWSTVATNQVLFTDASNSILAVVTNAITDATNKVLVTVTNAITDATNNVLVTVTNAIAASAATNAPTNWVIAQFVLQTNGYGTNTILDEPVFTNADFYGPALSYSTSASNAPSPNEFPTAQWVRSLFSGGTFLYNVTNVHPVNPSNYVASVTTNTTEQVRYYTNVLAGGYLGAGIMSTQRYTTVYSPMSVNAYLSLSSGGAHAATVHPEFYYTYDGTNLLGDYDCGGQALTSGATNLKSYVISYPTITSTNTNGFFVVRKFKVDSIAGAGNVIIGVHGSGATPSHISFGNPPVTDFSLGVRGAIAAIVTNCPAITNATYDTNARTFILSGPPVMPLLSQADGTVGSEILNLQSDVQLDYTNSINTATALYLTNATPGKWFTVTIPSGSNTISVYAVGYNVIWLNTNYCKDGSFTNTTTTNKWQTLSGRVLNGSGVTNIRVHTWQQP